MLLTKMFFYFKVRDGVPVTYHFKLVRRCKNVAKYRTQIENGGSSPATAMLAPTIPDVTSATIG